MRMHPSEIAKLAKIRQAASQRAWELRSQSVAGSHVLKNDDFDANELRIARKLAAEAEAEADMAKTEHEDALETRS